MQGNTDHWKIMHYLLSFIMIFATAFSCNCICFWYLFQFHVIFINFSFFDELPICLLFLPLTVIQTWLFLGIEAQNILTLSFKFFMKVLMKVKYITSGFLQWIGTWENVFLTLAKEPLRWKIHFLLKAI